MTLLHMHCAWSIIQIFVPRKIFQYLFNIKSLKICFYMIQNIFKSYICETIMKILIKKYSDFPNIFSVAYIF